jgi:hypothetical protein
VGGEQDEIEAQLSAAWDNPEPVVDVERDDVAVGQGDVGQDDVAVGQDDVEPSAVTAPEHWSAADREAFEALPDAAKQLYMETRKSLERGYQAKFDSLADERKSVESLREFQGMFDENQLQQIQMAGLTPGAYVKRLVQIGQALATNPQQMLEYLAQQHGVSFGQSDDGSERIAQIHSSEWAGFVNAKDQSGNALYPNAERLRGRIGRELQQAPERPGESIRDALVSQLRSRQMV